MTTGATGASSARTERQLLLDGFEDLGTLTLGGTLVAGDPTELLDPPGSGGWHGVAVTPGRWRVFGRPTDDGLAFTEVVLVHASAVASFYDLYDDAAPAAAFLLPTARVLVVDGARRTDTALLKAASEPDELPWVLDDGIVLHGLAQHPAHVWLPKGAVALLVAVALDAAPTHRVPSEPHASTDRREED